MTGDDLGRLCLPTQQPFIIKVLIAKMLRVHKGRPRRRKELVKSGR